MPIYTYRCENCATQFEQRQSFTDAPLTVCPTCNQSQLRKVITPAGIVFKGSGWYVTDHKSKSSAVQPVSTKTESKSESKDAAPVASAAPAADSGSSSSTSTSSDSSASKSDSSAAKSSSSE